MEIKYMYLDFGVNQNQKEKLIGKKIHSLVEVLRWLRNDRKEPVLAVHK